MSTCRSTLLASHSKPHPPTHPPHLTPPNATHPTADVKEYKRRPYYANSDDEEKEPPPDTPQLPGSLVAFTRNGKLQVGGWVRGVLFWCGGMGRWVGGWVHGVLFFVGRGWVGNVCLLFCGDVVASGCGGRGTQFAQLLLRCCPLGSLPERQGHNLSSQTLHYIT